MCFKKSTGLKPYSHVAARCSAEIFRFAQIEIQSAFQPPPETLLPRPLATATGYGAALTEILAFVVFRAMSIAKQ